MEGTALIDKLFAILEMAERRSEGVTAREIMQSTGWSKPSTYRILTAAVNQRFMRYDTANRSYALGFRLVELAQSSERFGDEAALASDELRRLRDLTGETVTLAMLEGTKLTSRATFESFHSFDACDPGTRINGHSTALGKACLAFSTHRTRAQFIKGSKLEKFTTNTITVAKELQHQLADIKQRGYSVDDEENRLGVRCVGAPILSESGLALGAVSLSGPTYRLGEDRLTQMGEEIRQIADSISVTLRDSMKSRSVAPDKPTLYLGQEKPAFHANNPQWIRERNALYWCDSLAPELNLTGAVSRFVVPPIREPIIATMLARSSAVAVTANHILLVDDNLQSRVADVGQMAGISGLSANCHGMPYGAIFDASQQTTEIGLLEPDGSMKTIWRVSARIRSLRWHPDGEQLFAADPERGVIYSLEKGSAKARVFSRLSQAAGKPSGMAVDTKGGLWVAMFDGWGIVRVDRFGEIDRTIALPVPRPTGVAFGGPSATTLFITSSRIGLDREVLEKAPLSGWLLQVETGMKGGLQGVSNYIPGLQGQFPANSKIPSTSTAKFAGRLPAPIAERE